MTKLFFSVMRFLLWVLILSWGIGLLRRAMVWLLRGALDSKPQNQGVNSGADPGGRASTRLVRDPICGVHVIEERALAVQDGGEVVHFCSEACRDQYVNNTKKLAANG